MVKKVILPFLFFILATGIFGTLNTKAEAVDVPCTTPEGNVGICTTLLTCKTNWDTLWDGSVAACNGAGCCFKDPVADRGCITNGGLHGNCKSAFTCDRPVWDPNVPTCDTTNRPGYGCCALRVVSPESATKVCGFAGTNQSKCADCMGDSEHSWTALGCISTKPEEFISQILGIGVGIAGGIAFLLILIGGFQILTSAGNPEKLNAGKELVTSAITGLLIIIFSLFILRLIGFTIFAIPGFG